MKRSFLWALAFFSILSLADEKKLYLYQKPYSGFLQDSKERFTSTDEQILEALVQTSKVKSEVQVPNSICGPKTVFTRSAFWSCEKGGWKNQYEYFWSEASKVWKDRPDLMQLCTLQSESTAQQALEDAKKNMKVSELGWIGVQFPFTEAGFKASLLAANISFEFGQYAIATILFENILEKAKMSPNLFGKFLTARTYLHAAFAAKRSGLRTQNEAVVLFNEAKKMAGAKGITIGFKVYSIWEIEEEFQKDFLEMKAEVRWDRQPFTFLFPNERRIYENARAVARGEKEDGPELVAALDDETRLFQLLITVAPKTTRSWMKKFVDLVKVSDLKAPSWQNLTDYLSEESNCVLTDLTYQPVVISIPSQTELNFNTQLNRFTKMELNEEDTIDNAFVLLSNLTGLKDLTIRNIYMGGDGFKDLKEFPPLENLVLEQTDFSDEALKTLKGFKNLKNLELSGNYSVGDEGITHLLELKNLEEFGVYSCFSVTDASLRTFEKMKKLRVLNIGYTSITREGLKSFKIPNLEKLVIPNTFGEDVKKAIEKNNPKLKVVIDV